MTRIFLNLLIAALVIVPLLTFANKPYLFSLDVLEETERAAYDLRVSNSVPKTTVKDEDIAIVNLDAKSLEREGDWPWRRDKIARLLKNLIDVYQARLVVFQDSFMLRDDQSAEIINDLRDRFYYDNAILSALEQVELDFNFDNQLTNEMDGRPVILGFQFEDAQRRGGRLPVTTDFIDADKYERIDTSKLRNLTAAWRQYSGYQSSDQEFIDRALDAGYSNFQIDPDGTLRSYPLGALYAGERYLSLAMVALRYFDNPRRPVSPVLLEKKGFTFFAGRSFEEVGIEGRRSAVSRGGKMLLSFKSRGGRIDSTFDYFSAIDIMDGNQLNISLRDKVVLVGSDALETNDFWRTPVNARMPGVEIQATAIRNVLDGTLMRSHNAWLYENIVLILLGVIMSFLYPKLRLSATLLITSAGLFSTYYINYEMLWLGVGEVYRIVPFLTLFVIMMFTNLVTGFIGEYRQKKKVEGVLNQYIPPELAKEVNTSKKGFSMEGEIREMTILFSDVRGFTSISERFKPKELTKFMNQMLSALSYQIHLNRGTIDKYIGDAVMAFWNAPLDDARHATNSVRAAMGMQKAMATLSKELVAKGYPELKMGVGINTGEACVGNMGSEIRLSYTVMGDSVNLASRLEGITKQYGVNIIVGERTYELTKDDFIYRPVDAVRVKGKSQAVVIYEPIADARNATENQRNLQDVSWAYWNAYCGRRFDEMAEILQRNLIESPEDGLMQLYLARATAYMQAPPGDDWEPVTTFDTK